MNKFQDTHLSIDERFKDAQLLYSFEYIDGHDYENPDTRSPRFFKHSIGDFMQYFSNINIISKDLEYIMGDVNDMSFSKASTKYLDPMKFLRIWIYPKPDGNILYRAEIRSDTYTDKISHLINKKEYYSNEIEK